MALESEGEELADGVVEADAGLLESMVEVSVPVCPAWTIVLVRV